MILDIHYFHQFGQELYVDEVFFSTCVVYNILKRRLSQCYLDLFLCNLLNYYSLPNRTEIVLSLSAGHK